MFLVTDHFIQIYVLSALQYAGRFFWKHYGIHLNFVKMLIFFISLQEKIKEYCTLLRRTRAENLISNIGQV